MNYQIKPMMNVEARDIESVVHPNHLKVYFRQLNIQPSFELMSHMHVLLVRGLAYEHRVIDHLGQVKNCVPFALRACLRTKLNPSFIKTRSARYSFHEPEPAKSVYESLPPLSASVVEYEKHQINVQFPSVEEVLETPELQAIEPVNLDPASMLANDIKILSEQGKAFIENPSLSGAAAMAITAIPGKAADALGDGFKQTSKMKNLDVPIAKSLLKMKRFKVPCFTPGPSLKSKFKGRERALESHFSRQLEHQQAGLNDLTVGEYIENRNRYKAMKRAGTGLAQEEFRKDFSKDLNNSLYKSYKKRMKGSVAKIAAKQRSFEIMENLAALHDPDMIAGGGDKVGRMGDKGVNASIGSQWRHQSRLSQMDKQAQLALEKFGPDAKMSVSLERCPLSGRK